MTPLAETPQPLASNRHRGSCLPVHNSCASTVFASRTSTNPKARREGNPSRQPHARREGNPMSPTLLSTDPCSWHTHTHVFFRCSTQCHCAAVLWRITVASCVKQHDIRIGAQLCCAMNWQHGAGLNLTPQGISWLTTPHTEQHGAWCAGRGHSLSKAPMVTRSAEGNSPKIELHEHTRSQQHQSCIPAEGHNALD
jgi:hypothetical protein